MLYHYSVLAYLPMILESELRPSYKGVDEMKRFGVVFKPTLWFSNREQYEPTALKGIPPKLEVAESIEQQCEWFTAIRISIEDTLAPLTWRSWSKNSGVSDTSLGKKYVKMLDDEALRRGSNVASFRVTFEPIKPQNFVSIQVLHKGAWEPYTGDETLTAADSWLMATKRVEIEMRKQQLG